MKRNFTFRTLLVAFTLLLGGGTSWGETITKTVYNWNFKGYAADANVTVSTESIIERIDNNNITFNLATAPDDCAGLYFYDNWKRYKNNNALRNISGGDRGVLIPNLQKGDVITVSCDNTDYITTTKYTGTANSDKNEMTFVMEDNGNFYFYIIKAGGKVNNVAVYPSIYSIKVTRELQVVLKRINTWTFTGYAADADVTVGTETLTENEIVCNLATAPDDCAGLYFWGTWKRYKNTSGLRNISGGSRMIIVPNLEENDIVTITCNNTDYITTPKYAGTVNTGKTEYTVMMEKEGNYYFYFDRVNNNNSVYPYITSITVDRPVVVEMAEVKAWNFKGYAADANITKDTQVTITEGERPCNPVTAPSDCAGLYLDDAWKRYKGDAALRNVSTGDRMCLIPDLLAGDVVVIECSNTDYINTTKYTGTANAAKTEYTFTMEANGNFYFKIIKAGGKVDNVTVYPSIYSITVKRPIEEGKTISQAIGDAEWSTLYTAYPLDFSNTGLTAYTATVSDNVVTLAEVTNVPAYTGVVLKGATGSYEVPAVTSSTTDKGELQGSLNSALTYDENAANDYYMLALNGNKVQFTKLTSGSIAAGKAYLVLPKDPTTGARTLTVAFSEGGTTGIKQIENGELTIDNYYNLNGQRVSKPTKGLYIVNGKKVVLK